MSASARICCSFLLLSSLLACQREALPAAPARLVLEAAPAEGDVATLVQTRHAAVGHQGGHLLVYVGATWCEPCQEFHKAAASGALDPVFPGLVLLEFDLDRDRERLLAAGYGSRLVPLFARPAADGRASGKYTEGVRKGVDAVGDLTPRLAALLQP